METMVSWWKRRPMGSKLRRHCWTAATVTQGGSLNDPLGLTVANGNILTVNGNNGFLVETTPDGEQIKKTLLDSSGNPPGAGALFGLIDVNGCVYYVDDATNTLNLFR